MHYIKLNKVPSFYGSLCWRHKYPENSEAQQVNINRNDQLYKIILKLAHMLWNDSRHICTVIKYMKTLNKKQFCQSFFYPCPHMLPI
ncbi:hypothetical protein GDO86_000556 [Hymenochirus boettgeri]|uniref:Uncharacterized protein n=1 Tax=Hymenochirus boettgeri TaxID=247094 RepID=A0A8T2KH94_9PIPI|nr:hypothetical protein GDO86_000556 [Hymenochirus boettgeri]